MGYAREGVWGRYSLLGRKLRSGRGKIKWGRR